MGSPLFLQLSKATCFQAVWSSGFKVSGTRNLFVVDYDSTSTFQTYITKRLLVAYHNITATGKMQHKESLFAWWGPSTFNTLQNTNLASPRRDNIGALIIRKGVWGPLHYNHNKESPK